MCGLQDSNHPQSVLTVARGRFPCLHALNEYFRHVLKWLRLIKPNNFRISTMEPKASIIALRSSIEQTELVFRDIVKHRHPLVADHRKPSRLNGIEPTHMHVSYRPRRKPKTHESNVLDPSLKICLPLCRDLHGLLFEKIKDHGEVVRRQAPKGVLFGANHAEIQPLAGKVKQFAEFPLFYEHFERPNRGVIFQEMIDHKDAVLLFGNLNQAHRIVAGQGDRFLHEDVLPCQQRLTGKCVMSYGRGGHDNNIYGRVIRTRRHFNPGVGGFHFSKTGLIRIEDKNGGLAKERAEDAHVILSPSPGTKNRDPHLIRLPRA